MMTRAEYDEAKRRSVAMLRRTGVRLRDEELEAVRVLDFGLSEWETHGLGMLVLVSTPLVVVKLLTLLPGQTCPEHMHIATADVVAKEETWRCEWGELHVMMPGEATPRPAARIPAGREACYTSRREIVLRPGEQFTSPGQTRHWFQGGPDGAVTWAFETPSPFACGVFTDPSVDEPPAKISD